MMTQNEPAETTEPVVTDSTPTPEGAEASGQDDLVDLRVRLQTAEARAEENYDLLLRARAEVENVRRRAHEDVTKARKFAIEAFAESLMPVKDSLEAALAQEQEDVVSRTGVETILKQVSTVFERHRLVEISPEVGTKFDPHQCQALSAVASEQAADTIVQVLQKGYQLADRVLRPALVTVSSGQAN